MQTMSRVVNVIDAIEELGDTIAIAILAGLWNVVDALRREQQDNRLRVFVSCRSNPQLPSAGASGLNVMHLGDVNMESSIEMYLRASIDDLAAQNAGFGASITPDLRRQIVSRISKAADGMFLAAVLAWEDFQRGLHWNREVVAKKLERVVSVGRHWNAFLLRQTDGENRRLHAG